MVAGRHWVLLFAMTFVAMGATAPTGAVAASDPDAWILCHDEKRSVVRRMQRFRCQHTEVSEEAAARIRAERVNRVRRSLDGGYQPPEPGLRLSGTGSSFFVDRSGRLLTNAHVVNECAVITVTPTSGKELRAEILRMDAPGDLALLQATSGSDEHARFRPPGEVAADAVLSVVGYPSRGRVSIRPTLVTGRPHDAEGRPADVLALRMPVRSGHSGGPVLDETGRVVGVVFAAVNTPGIYARSGIRIRDVGLAVAGRRVVAFLGAAGVVPHVLARAPRLSDRVRLGVARGFVAQVRCWR